MPRWCPSGLTVSKAKIATLESKEEQRKKADKISNDTHPQYPPPQKRWKPKVVEANQMATKTKNKTAAA
jgi:hypothetical protein